LTFLMLPSTSELLWLTAARDPIAVAFVSAVPTLVKLPMALLPEPVWFA
jgi:hypothetical protein